MVSPRRLVYRLGELVLILLGLAAVLGELVSVSSVLLLAVWNLVAFGYVLLRWRRVRDARLGMAEREDGSPAWLRTVAGRKLGFVATVLASLVGVLSGLMIVLYDRFGMDGELTFLIKLIGAPTIIFAWLMLHLGFAERYAHLHYELAGGQGLGFPDEDEPNLAYFAYFAFTIGTSFAVSDVTVRRRELRYAVLVHSTMSFLYNTALLGIAIGVLTGR
ncbi:DUF1345 domain-containing protein [Crossiella cryophila]|uniref:Putative membrane protein n=1 Tax=Crossiella cryophila TaxID=43355 RepID=A0A7W7FRE4_9PSEU|nr:DUF1345 domain-containing protein [Crossiella cryophila]MBB4674258.1 putative membrane protein [Crossiella cryophila]